MKVVILAGGLGTRFSEETVIKPKPMIEIGDKPILWHIMKLYSHYGYNEFVICAGYKQNIIKEWFSNYFLYNSDVTFDFEKENKITIHNNDSEPWKVTIVDTGLNTMTGGRIKRIKDYVKNEPFFLTYGDGVSNVNIKELYKFHKENGKLLTLTAVNIPQRYGILKLNGNIVESFREKDDLDGSLINGGFMVCEPKIFDYIENDSVVFEKEPMNKLSSERQMIAYKHAGYWQSMDSKREKDILEELWANNEAPWKVWD